MIHIIPYQNIKMNSKVSIFIFDKKYGWKPIDEGQWNELYIVKDNQNMFRIFSNHKIDDANQSIYKIDDLITHDTCWKVISDEFVEFQTKPEQPKYGIYFVNSNAAKTFSIYIHDAMKINGKKDDVTEVYKKDIINIIDNIYI